MNTLARPDLNEDRRRFHTLAESAIKAGKLTAEERDVICRPGSRKAGYWKRHLLDLRAVLAERSDKVA